MAQEEEKKKKGFFQEFKQFITRGNVLDLAVGIIIGGAFTAIVNALCNNILKPIVNWILALIVGSDSLTEVYTFLKRVEVDGVVDLSQSIYIDWGAFINAVINFFLIALVLFLIIKALVKVQKLRDQAKTSIGEAEQRRRAEKEAVKASMQSASSDAPDADRAPAPDKTASEQDVIPPAEAAKQEPAQTKK